MGIFSNDTKSKSEKPLPGKYILNPIEDFLSFTIKDKVEITLFCDHLNMKSYMSSNTTVYSISFSQITDVVCGTEEEIIQKGKSSIGRAIAGGVLFGGVGAVVGAMSGVGDKKVKKSKTKVIIAYTSSEGEDKFLQFYDTTNMIGKPFADKLFKLCNLKEKKKEYPKSGNITL